MEDPRYKNFVKVMRILGYSTERNRYDEDLMVKETTIKHTVSADLISSALDTLRSQGFTVAEDAENYIEGILGEHIIDVLDPDGTRPIELISNYDSESSNKGVVDIAIRVQGSSMLDVTYDHNTNTLNLDLVAVREKGKGIGQNAMREIMRACADHGTTLSFMAAGAGSWGDHFIGYYIWAKEGFDGPVSRRSLEAYNKDEVGMADLFEKVGLPDKTTVQDIIGELGLDWWENYGIEWHCEATPQDLKMLLRRDSMGEDDTRVIRDLLDHYDRSIQVLHGAGEEDAVEPIKDARERLAIHLPVDDRP